MEIGNLSNATIVRSVGSIQVFIATTIMLYVIVMSLVAISIVLIGIFILLLMVITVVIRFIPI